jgi:hypothetical protein
MIKIVKGKNASHKTPDFSENREIPAADCRNRPRFRYFRPTRQDLRPPQRFLRAARATPLADGQTVPLLAIERRPAHVAILVIAPLERAG